MRKKWILPKKRDLKDDEKTLEEEPNLCGSQNPTLRAESVHDPSKRAPPDVLAA